MLKQLYAKFAFALLDFLSVAQKSYIMRWTMKVSPDCSKVPRTAKSGKIDEERMRRCASKKENKKNEYRFSFIG